MAEHPAVFDDLYLSMIRVGEASGSLSVTVARLADVMERDAQLRRKVRAALAYPIFVLAFSMVLVYCLVAFLLPNFRPIFESSGLDLRRDYPMTQILMDTSLLVTNPYFMGAVLSGAILLGVLLRLGGRTGPGRLVIDSVKFYFPFLHSMIAMATITRFCRTFGVMLRSGVPLLESLIHVGSAAGNMVVTRSIQRVTRELQAGEKISQTLGKVPLFPPLLVQMVTVGEETGTIDQMFERVADYYEQELETAISSVLSLIEPLMMIIVGGIVCFFVMGVLLPIMGISTAYQNKM
jgi:type IV pilus assembly protein PilC